MSTPSVRAASSTFVPLGTVTAWPSMVRVTVSVLTWPLRGTRSACGYFGSRKLEPKFDQIASLVALPADHIDHAEDRDDVRDQVTVNQLTGRREMHERWRA